MALIDSRLGPGTLTLGTTEYGTQASNVRLTPNHEDNEGTPTLGIPVPAPEVKTTWVLAGTAVQDWEDAAGFIEYCRDNNNTQVSFSWEPNTDAGVTFSGTCLIKAVEIGGDVAVQTTSDFEFPVVGDVTRVDA